MNTSTLSKNLSVAACSAVLVAFSTTGSAQALTLSATDQGWWGTTAGHGSNNQNYITGQLNDSTNSYRSYFTFNLTGVTGGEVVSSAILKLQRHVGAGSSSHTFGLFDVFTSATDLDQNSGPNAAIFNDLGTGTSYGTYTVSTTGNENEILSFVLNSNGIAAINNSLSNPFSIGGALLGSLGSGEQYLFGFSGGLAKLELETAPATSIPAPALLPALIGIGLGAWRKRKVEVAKMVSEV